MVNRLPGFLRGTWRPMLLLGSGFTFFALFGFYAFVKHIIGISADNRMSEWSGAFGPALVICVFAPIGILSLSCARLFWTEEQQQRQLTAKFPRQPWKHRSDWLNKRSDHILTSQAITLLGLMFSLNVMTVGGSLAFLLDQEPAGALIFGAFSIITLTGGLYALWVTSTAMMYRGVTCELIDPPFQPGGTVRCIIHWVEARPPAVPLLVSLECSTHRSFRPRLFGRPVGRAESRWEVLYHACVKFSAAPTRLAAEPISRPIGLELPATAPETDAKTSTEWKMTVSWLSLGLLTRSIEFEIPVFRMATGRLTSEPPAEQLLEPVSHAGADTIEGGTIFKDLLKLHRGSFRQSHDGWELRLPRTTGGPVHHAVLIFVTIIAFTTWGFFLGGWSGIFFIIVPWLALPWMLGSQRLGCDGTQLLYRRRTLFRPRAVSIQLADIQSFEVCRTEITRALQVMAVRRSGARDLLLPNAFSPALGSAIHERLQAELRAVSD